jgi:hypothetical protein
MVGIGDFEFRMFDFGFCPFVILNAVKNLLLFCLMKT